MGKSNTDEERACVRILFFSLHLAVVGAGAVVIVLQVRGVRRISIAEGGGQAPPLPPTDAFAPGTAIFPTDN